MTELEKLQAGEWYHTSAPELRALRNACYARLDALNALSNSEKAARYQVMQQLFGAVGQGVNVKSMFQCDYGVHIFLGDGVFVNCGCVFSDSGRITIGSKTLIGPQVGIYAVTHPLDARARESGVEAARPVTIGRNCWIGGHATINPGVRLGDNVVVASGAVVTHSFGDNVLIGGVPARVMREIPPSEG